MSRITFNDWKKLEIRVGKIVTGLVPFYSEKELQDKKIIVLVNLEPVKFKGELSEGMLLCAEDKENNKCVLLTVEKDIEPGTVIT